MSKIRTFFSQGYEWALSLLFLSIPVVLIILIIFALKGALNLGNMLGIFIGLIPPLVVCFMSAGILSVWRGPYITGHESKRTRILKSSLQSAKFIFVITANLALVYCITFLFTGVEIPSGTYLWIVEGFIAYVLLAATVDGLLQYRRLRK